MLDDQTSRYTYLIADRGLRRRQLLGLLRSLGLPGTQVLKSRVIQRVDHTTIVPEPRSYREPMILPLRSQTFALLKIPACELGHLRKHRRRGHLTRLGLEAGIPMHQQALGQELYEQFSQLPDETGLLIIETSPVHPQLEARIKSTLRQIKQGEPQPSLLFVRADPEALKPKPITKPAIRLEPLSGPAIAGDYTLMLKLIEELVRAQCLPIPRKDLENQPA